MGVQRRAVPHFKDLFKIFKMRYSTSLYSDGIIFKFRFQKSRFIEEIGKVSGYFFGGVYIRNIFHMVIAGPKINFVLN